MEAESTSGQGHGPVTIVRVWSPLAVALYGLLIGYPAALILAVRTWSALKLWRELTGHLVGGILLSLPFIGISLFSPQRIVRFFALVINVSVFVYIKAKLNSDLQEARKADPTLVIDYRPWYSGAGWAVLGVLALVALFLRIYLVLLILDIPVPE